MKKKVQKKDRIKEHLLELKLLRYEIQTAKVSPAVNREAQILDEEYDVIRALSDDGDLTPIEFGINDNDLMRAV